MHPDEDLATAATPAVILNREVEYEVAALQQGEFRLNQGYARLARLLVVIKQSEAWRELKHPSFNSYLLSLQERYGRSSKQLYVYISAAEQLLSTVSEADLDRMGITKAESLARASRKAGKPVTPELLAAALDIKIGVNELRGLAHQVYNLPLGEHEKGNWFDFGGAFLTVDERRIFVDAVRIASRVLDLPKDMPDWLKRKKIFLAFAAEFDGTYRSEVYGEGMGGDRAGGTGDPDLQNKEGGGSGTD